MSLAILMHDAAHYMLFKRQKVNRWIGSVFCGAPVTAYLDAYRTHHLQRHKDAGTQNDPDYLNYKNDPITHASLLRKVARDLCGTATLKIFWSLLLMNAGVLNYDFVYKNQTSKQTFIVSKIVINLVKGLWLPVFCNVMLWFILFSPENAYLYLLWVAAYFTFYPLFLRLRNAVEHAAVPNLLGREPRKHARTTNARWWDFHQYLVVKGYYNDTYIAQGYGDVLKQLTHTN